MKFIRHDADRIGGEIELALLNKDIEKANTIHLSVQKGMLFLEDKITANPDFRILMTGCDDILATYSGNQLEFAFLEELIKLFHSATESTISISVGDNLQEAVLNLRKAKLLGRKQIVGM